MRIVFRVVAFIIAVGAALAAVEFSMTVPRHQANFAGSAAIFGYPAAMLAVACFQYAAGEHRLGRTWWLSLNGIIGILFSLWVALEYVLYPVDSSIQKIYLYEDIKNAAVISAISALAFFNWERAFQKLREK